MDIASVFSILSQGRIISMNSKEYEEYAYFLANDTNFEEMDEIVRKIGYNLVRENGYFYMSKKDQMDSKERALFAKEHKDIILAVAIIRTLHSRKDRGASISFIETAAEYEAHKRNDSTIIDKIKRLSSTKNYKNEKVMLEQMFYLLEKGNVLEKISTGNDNDYKILDAVDYYINIVDKVEK
ncbi:MAG: hypothetical protein KU29_05420 [Sulfurovum sp. FS06-10]|jgi:hypothetical protein|nr:MAG: hypothetical protein KU29_05420 [Sulfurovum sp. FS06-10]